MMKNDWRVYKGPRLPPFVTESRQGSMMIQAMISCNRGMLCMPVVYRETVFRMSCIKAGLQAGYSKVSP